MYTKAQYLKDIKNYDFKKYKVDVKHEGDCADNLVFKVLLDGKVVYETRKGAFIYNKFKSGAFRRTKWFIKYEEFEDVTITWRNNKEFMKFTSWCSNYRVQNEIKIKFQEAKDDFKRTMFLK